ncbi:DUF3040 domain-containing protein [Streptomonospora sp. S1-112]|uniref:DUF3040 domain-containing protein n=1 Tax=Streptomonospora mangrovi TaxID=2883123 RepID=A0A9X3SGN0_9ACTN|nr:DUF3040 domain-containing protein [Streptomonospora mangrovi]MDA0567988.1 DUF3040 domain-containing protein [Streptomonospora mangrovi]
MAISDDDPRLSRIEEWLAVNDPAYVRRVRRYSERLADRPAAGAAEPVPWAAVALLWAVVLAAALALVLTTALTV